MGGNSSSSKIVQSPNGAAHEQQEMYGLESATPLTPLEKAYNKGKEDEQKKLEGALNAVAAQVYDNINDQMRAMQTKQLDEAAIYSVALNSRLKQPAALKSYCDIEKNKVMSCLADNNHSIFHCAEAMDDFSACASIAVTSSVNK